MKKLILLLSIVFIINETKAQYVTIPSPQFVTWLQSHFPSCISGNQMDTTCVAITSATYINLGPNFITDLTGIQYFDNLDSLNCMDSHALTYIPALPGGLTYFDSDNSLLASLPVLPNGITYMDCRNNVLTSLPALPNALITLYCCNNQLTSLPVLPNSLQDLYCENNLLTSLPALPNSLGNFNCNNNQITSLPTLPNSLVSLNCSYNLLTVLPSLPNSLTNLNCKYNQITNMPALSNSFFTLDCSHNQITSLPALGSSLWRLTCNDNQLTSLPSLPNTLEELYCQNNQITTIPTLPGNNNFSVINCSNNLLTILPALPFYLNTLICSNNNIFCMPLIPMYVGDSASFQIYNNPVTCLPNYTVNMPPYLLAYPLCILGDLVNNPNNCANAEGIAGFVYKDINGNCMKDAGDTILSNFPIKLYTPGNVLISQSYTAVNGVYSFPELAGTYVTKIDTTGFPLVAQCNYPGIDSTVILTLASPLAQDVNFSFTCPPGFDIGTKSVLPQGQIFPGQFHGFKFNTGDLSNWYHLHCASGVSGQVVATFTGPINFDSIYFNGLVPSVAGNVFTYSIPDFGTIPIYNSFKINKIYTDTTANIGDSICVNILVTPTAGDNNTSNNNFNYCYYVGNSYDPNYKETYPRYVSYGFDDYFYYTIHFQNVGSSAAINIHVLDTLDSNLDLNTFEVIDYSHPNTTWLTGRNLAVYFTNINLPDSTTDFDGSQGFIQYRIKPKLNRPGGTQVHNRASIYFDYNAPVVTNATLNQFGLSNGISQLSNLTSQISIYPNPTNGKFTIVLRQAQDDGKLKLEITNVLGEIIYQSEIHNLKSEINLSNQPAGIYFVRIIGGTQSLNQKMVKSN